VSWLRNIDEFAQKLRVPIRRAVNWWLAMGSSRNEALGPGQDSRVYRCQENRHLPMPSQFFSMKRISKVVCVTVTHPGRSLNLKQAKPERNFA